MAQSGSNPFIVTTPMQQQPDRASRRNARSYAMRGKNRGKSGKRRAKLPCLASWINGPSHGGADTNLIPRQVSSEWALGRFVEDVEPDILQNIFKFLAVLERALHPNPILAGDDDEPQAPICFGYMGHNPTFFHSQLFVTMAYFNTMGGRDGDIGTGATLHMTKALSFLQTDLATIDRATTEATLLVVTVFAMVAFVSGDIASAENHIHGLFKLVTMRGGVRSLRAHRHLQTKCCRLDLGYAIITGSKPLFFADDDISWNLYLSRSTPVPRNTAIHLLLPSDSMPDPRMLNVWRDLYEFSRAANIATQTGRKLEANLLQEVMISIQYRLLHLQYSEDDTHTLLRMVMLAYSTTIFPILFSQFGPTPLSYLSLPSCLRGFLIVPLQASREKLKALLWLLVIIRISISEDELIDLQLARTVQALDLNTWDEVLVILKGFLWVDVLHKEQAKRHLDKISPWHRSTDCCTLACV